MFLGRKVTKDFFFLLHLVLSNTGGLLDGYYLSFSICLMGKYETINVKKVTFMLINDIAKNKVIYNPKLLAQLFRHGRCVMHRSSLTTYLTLRAEFF